MCLGADPEGIDCPAFLEVVHYQHFAPQINMSLDMVYRFIGLDCLKEIHASMVIEVFTDQLLFQLTNSMILTTLFAQPLNRLINPLT